MALKPLVAAVLTLLSLSLIAVGAIAVPAGLFSSGTSTYLALGLVILGIAGYSIQEALGVEFSINGLTPEQRQVLFGVSVFLVGVGALSIPFGVPLYVSFVLSVLGMIGLSFRVALGTQTLPVKASP